MSIKWSGKSYQDPCTKLFPYACPGGSSQKKEETTTHCPDNSAERELEAKKKKTQEEKWKAYENQIREAQRKRDEARSKQIEETCQKYRKEERRIDDLPPFDSYQSVAFALGTLAYGMKKSLCGEGPKPGEDYSEVVAREAIVMIRNVAALDAGLSTAGDAWHRRRNSFRTTWSDIHAITKWMERYSEQLRAAGPEWSQKAICVGVAADEWASFGKCERVRKSDLITKVLAPEHWPMLWAPIGTRTRDP